MKLFTNLALMTALGTIAASSASASIVNYYATGTFTSATGGVIGTNALPPFGPVMPNGSVTFTTGLDNVRITFAYLGDSVSPTNINTPSNVSYGIFDVDNFGAANPVTIGAFAFSLVIHDVTDGGTTTFNGTSSGGTIAPNSSTVLVNWSPLIAPAIGTTQFQIFSPSPLVPPSSTAGQTTIQGFVTSTVPEPASMFLMGAGLLGLGFVSRRKLSRKA